LQLSEFSQGKIDSTMDDYLKMLDKNRKLIIVLSMHRSGTSAISRGLQVMGAELGDRLMPPNQEVNACVQQVIVEMMQRGIITIANLSRESSKKA
jgi:hypothetical protein